MPAPDLTFADDTANEKVVTRAAGPGSYSNATYQRQFKVYALPKATDSPLDFRSAQFDALKALQTPKQQLKLPVATAYPLDNIQKCRHLVRLAMRNTGRAMGWRLIELLTSKLPESDANRQTLVARPKKASPSAAETKAASVKKAPASATRPC
ncbi:hypothetical protein GQ600_4873 [Phytophthora cactorum]|nr:hypothetical protein GQ600_4873 [Phytophthora cactorum]